MDVHPLVAAVKRAGPVPADFVQQLRLQEWSAIEALEQGNASVVDLQIMRELLSISACSVEAGIGPEAEPACESARAVLAAFEADPLAGSVLRMNSGQIATMRELQNFHDLQRAACTWEGYFRLIEKAAALQVRHAAIVS